MPLSRRTKQRELIDKEIKNLNGFFTAEQLFKNLSKKDKTLGIATIYRNLKDLRKKNKLFSYTCERKTLHSTKKSMHCHFICKKTGKTIHFKLNNINFLKQIEKEIPGSIDSIQLEVHGICDNCQTTKKII